MNPAAADKGTRLFFLDWLRIIAFFVLILYHVGMYYVTWGWHVKSPFASDVIEPLMLLSSPWRLGLLFLISGVASRFMLMKISAGGFMRQRSSRLLVPLLFGMLVIVPPQSYFEVIEKVGYTGSYLDFMQLYLRAYHGFCTPTGGCLILPTWNHLWFVAYLWVYTVLLGVLMLVARTRFDTLSQRAGALLTGWKLVVLPLAVLAAARLLLVVRYPSTHALYGDWYNHAHYLFLFLLGAMLAPQRQVWERLDAMRWTAFGTALACWAFLIAYFSQPDDLLSAATMAWLMPLQRVIYALCQWSAIMAACGFAHRHLQFDSAKRRYLTQAVFPVYMVHQTLIVVLAHTIQPLRMAPRIEGTVLAVLTLAISFGLVEAVRRCRPLQPLFGMGKVERETAQDTGRLAAHA